LKKLLLSNQLDIKKAGVSRLFFAKILVRLQTRFGSLATDIFNKLFCLANMSGKSPSCCKALDLAANGTSFSVMTELLSCRSETTASSAYSVSAACRRSHLRFGLIFTLYPA
jgi:hypothetical protein